jgi:hypothetical protein
VDASEYRAYYARTQDRVTKLSISMLFRSPVSLFSFYGSVAFNDDGVDKIASALNAWPDTFVQ